MQSGPESTAPVDDPTRLPPAIGHGMSPKKKGLPWWAILLIVAAVLVPACGVMASFAIYGVRKYVVNAKHAEARGNLVSFARGVAACAETEGGLPQTSAAVPASLSSVQGVKYQSSEAEWTSDPTLQCAGFSMSSPQYFQYQWVRQAPDAGHVQALADLDGDGAADARFELALSCAGGADCKSSGQVMGP